MRRRMTRTRTTLTAKKLGRGARVAAALITAGGASFSVRAAGKLSGADFAMTPTWIRAEMHTSWTVMLCARWCAAIVIYDNLFPNSALVRDATTCLGAISVASATFSTTTWASSRITATAVEFAGWAEGKTSSTVKSARAAMQWSSTTTTAASRTACTRTAPSARRTCSLPRQSAACCGAATPCTATACASLWSSSSGRLPPPAAPSATSPSVTPLLTGRSSTARSH
mmetsp:Transcript_21439/g.50873  ORF Transcript_21439/g.50873 Transcript_21439/m.50873 type:complete len:227 (-) Transcript_21439:432-1112(-)